MNQEIESISVEKVLDYAARKGIALGLRLAAEIAMRDEFYDGDGKVISEMIFAKAKEFEEGE